MDAQSILVYVTAAGIIVTAVLSIWDGRRQSKHSQASADRAEAAGRVSDENAQRIIAALEKMAAGSYGSAETNTYTPPEKVRWSMDHYRGDTYQLTNIGNITAEKVQVSAHESLILRDQNGASNLAPDEAITFMAVQTMATSDSTITVNWEDTDGDHVWRYPLPARPPR